MSKIIITGASGFIGSNILKYYLNQGHDVLNIDIAKPEDSLFDRYWINIDILNYARLEKEILGYSPDYIFHFAARTDLDGKSSADYSANTTGTLNIIKAASHVPGIKRVIFASSMLVCRIGYIPSHSADYSPSTFYGESKVRMEEIIMEANPPFEWTIVRPTSIWGPGFRVPYRNFFDMVLKRRYFHIGRSNCIKTYGFIGNTLYQLDCLLKSPKDLVNSRVFYLGDYAPTNIREWADEIAEARNIKIKTLPLPVIKSAAIAGDILKLFGIDFPMTTFRLKNMTTNNIIDLANTESIAPALPYSRIMGIKETLNWLHK